MVGDLTTCENTDHSSEHHFNQTHLPDRSCNLQSCVEHMADKSREGTTHKNSNPNYPRLSIKKEV